MGNFISSFFSQTFPPKPTWKPEDVPDLSNKVFLITGANTGIGKEAAQELLAHNGRVYIAARSVEKNMAAIEDLKRATGKGDDDIRFLKLDLMDLKSVKSAVDEFLSKESRLDVLINNAGVLQMFGTKPEDRATPAGLNVEFAVNVLGHFYLTQLLLPTLISSAKSSSDGKVRVVNLSSNFHMLSKTGKNGPIDYRTLEGPQNHPYRSYSQSKSGNLLFSNELARRYGDQGIISVSLHPGIFQSTLFRDTPGTLRKTVLALFVKPMSYGKITTCYAATAPEVLEFNGKYLIPWGRVGYPRKDHVDPERGDKLWTWMEEKVKELA